MKLLTLLVIAGAVGSSVALALYVLLWRANVAVRKMAARAALPTPWRWTQIRCGPRHLMKGERI